MKYALVIGNSKYNDPKLAQLKTPEADSRALAKVLRAKRIGNFDEVASLIDQTEAKTRRAISTFLSNKKPDDLVLIYFSGHGVLDGRGGLFLALKDTQINALNATAISSSFLSYEMDSCRSRRQILILDCCNSGAFARGAKGPQKAVTESTFEGSGSGRVVLTASDSTQFAFEGDRVIAQTDFSLFTHFLLEGLKTGKADRDNDGKVSLDEWYDYCHARITATTPQQVPHKWSYHQQGDLIIAQNPFAKKKPQPKILQLRAMLDQKQKDFQQHKLLLDSKELAIITAGLGSTKLELQEADKQLILLSSVIYDDGQKWLAICSQNGLDWLRRAYQDNSYPYEVRLGAARCLGQMEDEQTYKQLLGEIQPDSQSTERELWLDLMAHYLKRSGQSRHLPGPVNWSVFTRLARLEIGEGVKERTWMRNTSMYAAFISVVILFITQFINENQGVDAGDLIIMVLLAALSAMLAYIFAEVITSLILIGRPSHSIWQIPILAVISSALGIALFFMITWDSKLWFTGAIIGPVLALFHRYLAQIRRVLPIAFAVLIAVSAFIFVRYVTISLSLAQEAAISASFFTGAYLYSAMMAQKISRE
jgi:hypothetical protein